MFKTMVTAALAVMISGCAHQQLDVARQSWVDIKHKTMVFINHDNDSVCFAAGDTTHTRLENTINGLLGQLNVKLDNKNIDLAVSELPFDKYVADREVLAAAETHYTRWLYLDSIQCSKGKPYHLSHYWQTVKQWAGHNETEDAFYSYLSQYPNHNNLHVENAMRH